MGYLGRHKLTLEAGPRAGQLRVGLRCTAWTSLRYPSTPLRTQLALFPVLQKKDEMAARKGDSLVLQLDTFAGTTLGKPLLR